MPKNIAAGLQANAADVSLEPRERVQLGKYRGNFHGHIRSTRFLAEEAARRQNDKHPDDLLGFAFGELHISTCRLKQVLLHYRWLACGIKYSYFTMSIMHNIQSFLTMKDCLRRYYLYNTISC